MTGKVVENVQVLQLLITLKARTVGNGSRVHDNPGRAPLEKGAPAAVFAETEVASISEIAV